MTQVHQGENTSLSPPDDCRWITWGVFDGVHRGHRTLVEATVQRGQTRGADSAVLTFREHPAEILRKEGPGRICSLDRRVERITALNPDHLIVRPFTKAFASLSPDRFVTSYLGNQLGTGGVCIGPDVRFGHRKEGTLDTLKKHESREVINLEVVEHRLFNGERISSTRVRKAIRDGRLKEAREMLGGAVIAEGTVIRGEGRGRDLGYPTANLDLDHEVHPPDGVYGGVVLLEEGPRPAVANVGTSPTFEGASDSRVEVHILNFHRDLYGQSLTFEFWTRISDEKSFESAEKLAEKIQRDIRKYRESEVYRNNFNGDVPGELEQ